MFLYAYIGAFNIDIKNLGLIFFSFSTKENKLNIYKHFLVEQYKFFNYYLRHIFSETGKKETRKGI